MNVKPSLTPKQSLVRRAISILKSWIKLTSECEGCHIYIGGLESHLIDYRGHRICSWCINNWKHREELAGYELSFAECRGETIEDKRMIIKAIKERNYG